MFIGVFIILENHCSKNVAKKSKFHYMAVYNKRENKKGVSYQAIVRVKGYKTICKTFKLKSQAQAWAEPIELQMKNGTYKDLPDFSADSLCLRIKTMHDLIKYFKTEVAPNRYVSAEKYETIYEWWDARIGSIKVQDLSASIISANKDVLRTEPIKKGKDQYSVRKNNTINKYLMCLSAVLTYAVKELEIIEVNPCSKVSLMPKPKGRTRFLTIQEISTFLSACKEHSLMIYIFALISISTGARYSEVLHLRVDDIDFDNLQLYYMDTKNKENRGVPVEQDLLDLIKKYLLEKKITSGNIFKPKRNDGDYPYIKGVIENIKKGLGVEYFRIHDLRHTTASYIAMNGGSLLDIAEILGHKSLVMARRYSHLTKKHTAAVMNKVTNKILPNI